MNTQDTTKLIKKYRLEVYLRMAIPAIAIGVALAIAILLHTFVYYPWFEKVTSTKTGVSTGFLVAGGFAFAAVIGCAAFFLIAPRRSRTKQGISTPGLWACLAILVVAAPLTLTGTQLILKTVLNLDYEIKMSGYGTVFVIPIIVYVIGIITYTFFTIPKNHKNDFGGKLTVTAHIAGGATTLASVIGFIIGLAQNNGKSDSTLSLRLCCIAACVSTYFVLGYSMKGGQYKGDKKTIKSDILGSTGLPIASVSTFICIAVVIIGVIVALIAKGGEKLQQFDRKYYPIRSSSGNKFHPNRDGTLTDKHGKKGYPTKYDEDGNPTSFTSYD